MGRSDDKYWEPWIRLLKSINPGGTGALYDLLWRHGKTPSERWVIGAALSVAKWHPLTVWHPLTLRRGGAGYCGLCLASLPESYLDLPAYAILPPDCQNCPLHRLGHSCLNNQRQTTGLYAAWRKSRDKKAADAMFEAVYEAYTLVYKENRELIESIEWTG
jgi:hypothetical protein